MHVTRKAGPLLGLATLTALCLAAFSLSATPAAAQTTVFNTFGPGNSFNAGGYAESGPSGSGISSLGAAFSPSATGALSSITVAYNNGGVGTDDAHLYLTDSFSKLGNTAASLDSFTFIPGIATGSIFVLPSALHPVLTAGQTYYLYDLEPGNEFDVWNESSPPVTGTYVLKSNSTPYTSFGNQTLPAFSIQEASPAVSSVVPESSGLANLSGALLALALAGIVTAVKKRKRQIS